MTFEKYIKKKGKKYRLGFTTGSAAAAAAKTACKLLFNKKIKDTVIIDTPYGIKLELEPVEMSSGPDFGRAAVIKDAGDDPDVTDGLKILARVKKIEKTEILIKGGKGVGKVTKPGLQVPKGEAAINPIPRQMIQKAVKEVLPEGQGIKIIIEVPQGEEVAARTFNPRLGIKGGISILGTTGIVEPMSESAYKESLVVELKQAAALGVKEIVLVFGNYGRKTALKLGYEEESIVKMSNFVGYMLDQMRDLEINKILIIGHIGKIVKVAGGIFNTHSQQADARKEIIAAYTALQGGPQKLVGKIMKADTAESASQILLENEMREVIDLLAERVVVRVKERLEEKIKVSSIIFSLNEGIMGSYGLSQDLKKQKLKKPE